MVRLNFVLSNIPIFFFFFYKATKVILNEITKIQRYFLWGGGEDSEKVCWVSSYSICLLKEDGGLWVKQYGLFNLALLSK